MERDWVSTGKLTAEAQVLPVGVKQLAEGRGVLRSYGRHWMALALLATDMLAVLAAVLIAMQIRRLPGAAEVHAAYDGIFVVLGVTLAVLFFRKGLYPAVGMHYVDELRNIVSSCAVAFLVMIGVTFAVQHTLQYSRVILFAAWLLSVLAIPPARYFARALLVRLDLWGEPVAIVGEARRCEELVRYFTAGLHFGLRPAAVVETGLALGRSGNGAALPDMEQMKELARSLSIKTVLVLIDDLNQIDTLVNAYRFVFPRVILLRSQTEGYGLSHLHPLDFMDLLGLQVRNNLLDASTQAYKRFIDVLASFIFGVLLTPVLGAMAALIRLDSPGGVFYRQQRLGRDGREFSLLKFRTMYVNADQVFRDSLAHNPALQEEWDRYQKLRDDPRVTRVGRFLRRFSLDELPQLWNIACGEMSLVGPRPIMPEQRPLYGSGFQQYQSVAPGITGLWQVSGRSETTFARRAALDVEYIQRWSLWLDIFILLKTVKIVLKRSGAW